MYKYLYDYVTYSYVQDHLDEMSKSGWELVSHQITDGGNHHFIWKKGLPL